MSKELEDVVSGGGAFAVSLRFREVFTGTDLKGFEFSEGPMTLTNSRAIFYMAQPAYTYTLIDTEASGAVVRKFVGCAKCGAAAYNKIDRIAVRKETWSGEDVFTLSSLSGVILVTEQFVDFVNANEFNGFSFVHQNDYRYDYSRYFRPEIHRATSSR